MHVIPTQRLPWPPGAASSSSSSRKFLHVLVLPSLSFSHCTIYLWRRERYGTYSRNKWGGNDPKESDICQYILIVIRGVWSINAIRWAGSSTMPRCPALLCCRFPENEPQANNSQKFNRKRTRRLKSLTSWGAKGKRLDSVT